MGELDRFVKQGLKVKYYLRYTDDFLIISEDKEYLKKTLSPIISFLQEELRLKIHDEKTTIQKTSQGVDFLGYVIFNKYKLIRTKTRKRIFKKFNIKIKNYIEGEISKNSLSQSLQSYLGFLCHGESIKIENSFKKEYLRAIFYK